MVTAGTLHKQHFFSDEARLELLQTTLASVLAEYQWKAQSWALFSNHYHFIAQAPSNAGTLRQLIQKLHSVTAREINRLDQLPGRKIWFQYWDTCLTHEKSYLARLNYVNNNPVHHGLVSIATQYRFCSAGWFEQNAEPGFRRKVASFRYDRIKVIDDF